MNIPLATSATLSLPAVAASDNGARIRCVATNAVGSNPSKEATLTVGTSQLANGGFEGGFAQTAWTTSGGASKASWTGKMIGDSTATSRLAPRTGAFYAYLGNISGTGSDYLYQDVTIPANAVSAKLTYSWAIRLGNSNIATGDVTLKVEILNPSGTLLATAKSVDVKAAGAAVSPAPWQPLESFDLLAFKGQTIRLRFSSVTAVSPSYAYIAVDDVTVLTVP